MIHRRRTAALACAFLLVAPGLALAQDAAAPSAPPAGAAKLGMDPIKELVAPIALYPDVLISQILPAATFPTDIVQAARWVEKNPDLKGIDEQKWDPSVLSVCRYKPVLDKMNNDLDWTNALGAAFLDQPDDVMNAIQELRKSAEASGVLKDTPQQLVVEEQEIIRIVPAEKEVVYVPQYNPQIIYVDDDDDDDDDDIDYGGALAAGAIGFGVGMAMGAWLDNDCDWHGHVVYGCRPGYWGGWGHCGAVNWDNDWYAARGPRRGFVKGENGGVAWGPNGRAVWGEHGAGVWRRPGGYYGRPAYTGRYAGYNYGNVSGNRRNVVAGNTVNRNNVNVNVDRGDRTNVRGGDRTNVGGDRTNIGGDRTNIGGGDRNRPGGDRPGVGGDRPGVGGDRPGVGGDRPGVGDDRPGVGGGRPGVGGDRPGAGGGGLSGPRVETRPSTPLNSRSGTSAANRAGDRGASSRNAAAQRPNSSVQRPQQPRASSTSTPKRSSTPSASRSSSSGSRSSFSSSSSRSQSRSASSRGSASRGGSRGGGRGGGRR